NMPGRGAELEAARCRDEGDRGVTVERAGSAGTIGEHQASHDMPGIQADLVAESDVQVRGRAWPRPRWRDCPGNHRRTRPRHGQRRQHLPHPSANPASPASPPPSPPPTTKISVSYDGEPVPPVAGCHARPRWPAVSGGCGLGVLAGPFGELAADEG